MTIMVEWKIGPTFADEIRAAGISFEGWSWGIFDGIVWFREDVPQITRDAISAVLAVHDPEKQTVPPTPYPPGAPDTQVPTLRWQVSRYTVLERLAMARHADAFFAVLDKAPRVQRELWAASMMIWNDDMAVRALLDKIGANPDEILAIDTTPGMAPPKPPPLANPPVMGVAVPGGEKPPPVLPQITRSRR